MKIVLINDIEKIENNCDYAICLGIFDGVHLGHRALINKTLEIAGDKNLKSGVLTFISKGEKGRIYPLETRIKLIEKTGIDTLFIIDFNDNFKNLNPEEFIDRYLIEYIRAKEVICGFNFEFGKGRKGNSDTLKRYEEKGYKLTVIPPVTSGEEIISSTLIKKYLKDGNIKRANELLSCDYTVSGCVKEGRKIGRTIKFPTANILVPYECMKIKSGVYASKVFLDGENYNGVSNVGNAPTVREDSEIITETYIVGLERDIYNKNIDVSFKDFIREERKFQNLDELKETIKDNLDTAMKILGDM